MATQTDATTLEVSEIPAQTVGYTFVAQFYQMLHTSPEFAYKYYSDSSSMSRPGVDGEMVTVTAMEGIKNLILSLDCTHYKAEILSADVQASHMDGVTVLVIGCLTGQDNVRRKFTESFFLAPQDKGYFVHNDVFRFINGDSSPVADTVKEQSDEPLLASPVNVVPLVQETAEVTNDSLENQPTAPEEELRTVVVPEVVQKPSSIEKPVPQTSVDSSPRIQPVVETPSNGDLQGPKKSYASLLMNGKHIPTAPKPVKPKAAAKSLPPAVQQIKLVTVPAATATTTATATATNESSVANVSNGNASANGHASGKGHSIYIGHLPHNATRELVEQEFKKFGRIKKNGIQVRTSQGYVFGFVEYEDATARENAVKTRTILIDGKKVFIEEKKTAARGDDYSSGRGGHRNDGQRRGNYSNGRGYVKNNYGNHNGEGPRGIPNGEGHVHQNGGGQSALRQGGVSK